MDVLRMQEVYIDGKESKTSCGVLIIDNSSGTNEFFLPQNDGTYEMKFSQDDVHAMFIYTERDMAGFFFKTEEGVTERRSLFFETEDLKPIFNLAINIFSKNQPLKPICKNASELKTFLSSDFLGLRNGEEEKLCESIFNTKIWDETRQCTSDSVEVYNLTHDFLLLYTTFIRMHKDQKKDKQKVKIQTNFPRVFESLEFLISSERLGASGILSSPLLLSFLFSFLDHHSCRNPSCDSFSWFMCNDCKVAHYCDVNCQEADWPRHEDVCQQMKEQREQMYLVPKLVQNRLEELHGKENIISFKVFASEMAYGAYSLFYGAIKNCGFGTFLEIMLQSSKIPTCMKETKTPLCKSRSKMLLLLEKDIENCSFKETMDKAKKLLPKDSLLCKLLMKSKMGELEDYVRKFEVVNSFYY